MLSRMIFAFACVAAATCTEYGELLKKLDAQQQQIDTLKSIVTSQAKERVHEKVQARKPVPQVAVYFSAAMNAPVDIVVDSTVLYNDIILNAGDLLATDGKFTCPVGGYYSFSVSLKSDALHVAHVNIVVDDGSVATVVASVMSVDGYDHASNTVVVECAAGNTVYVKGGSYGGRMFGESGSRYNTFSGQLLWVLA